MLTALTVFGVASALQVSYIVWYRLVRSPLAGLPGPKFAALTRLVLMWQEFTRRRTTWVHTLHERHGPIVRIAPDEVSFASWEAVKEIYVSGGTGYDKTTYYRFFDNYDTQ